MKKSSDNLTYDHQESNGELREESPPSKLNKQIEELKKEISKKDSEIEYLKEKLTNNQQILLDVIEDKKILKKQISEFELKEIDLRLNNFHDLQRKQHQTEHRLFVTKKKLDEARNELEFRKKIIEDMENRGIMDYIMGNYPESYVNYKKRGND
ncbi:MAG: hypothetical protein HVN35_10510 [Methanobacteriaceae archaeon]|nr:hypothetical protein [Methanobacteriaceae archaeon]